MVAWPLICLLVWCGCRVWDWVDEVEKTEIPTVERLLGLLLYNGWKRSPCGSAWKYYKGKNYLTKTDSTDYPGILFFGKIEILLPLIFLALYFYIPTIIVGLTALTLYTLRFVRRLHKKFNLHTEDKNAHK
jgi:hypothetical protein